MRIEWGNRVVVAAVWMIVGISSACGSPAVDENLPSEPFAFQRMEASQGIANLDQFLAAVDMNVGLPAKEIQKRRASRSARTSIMLMSIDTRELRPVPDAGLGAVPFDWSPDGLFLLLGRASRGERAFQLFSWNRLTGAMNRLNPDRSAGEAALGPGPIRLASVGRVMRGGSEALGLFLTTDTGTRPIAEGLYGIEPDISPDGLSVVFVRLNEKGGDDGTILLSKLGEQGTRSLGRGRYPRLSRDGRWIIYTTWRKGDADVWMMRTDGSGRRPIATSSYDEFFPAVSPDARYVVYASPRGDPPEMQIYMARVRDRRETQLTKHGQNGRPIW